jgi:hypothetical protein
MCGSGCITYVANADHRTGARIALYGSIEAAVPALIALAPLEDSEGKALPYIARVAIWTGTAVVLDGIVALIAYCGEPGRCKD